MLCAYFLTWWPRFSRISWQAEPQLASLPFLTPVSWGERRHSGWEWKETQAKCSPSVSTISPNTRRAKSTQPYYQSKGLHGNYQSVDTIQCWLNVRLQLRTCFIQKWMQRWTAVAFKLQPQPLWTEPHTDILYGAEGEKKSHQRLHLCISVQRKAAGAGRALWQQRRPRRKAFLLSQGPGLVFRRRRHSEGRRDATDAQ